MKAIIIGAGQIGDYVSVMETFSSLGGEINGDNQYIVCCDDGATHAKRIGFAPHLIIGDFDSIDEQTKAHYERMGVKFERYPAHKDYTDMHLGLIRALEMGADEVIFLGATGDRLDHTISNVTLLGACLREGVEACIVEDRSRMFLVHDKMELSGAKGRTLSLIPFFGSVTGVHTKNLKYPLNGETLSMGTTRGVSNVISEDYCEIRVDDGALLVVLENG